MKSSTSNIPRDHVYYSLECRNGAEIRARLTVIGGAPCIDIRFGELAHDGWHPSSRGVFVPVAELQKFMSALRNVQKDVNRFDLLADEYTRQFIHRRSVRRRG
jgi:hypothetical protein